MKPIGPTVSDPTGGILGAQVRSALLAGFIASTVWMFITVAVDGSKSAILVGGLLFLVGTALITAAVAAVISRNRAAST